MTFYTAVSMMSGICMKRKKRQIVSMVPEADYLKQKRQPSLIGDEGNLIQKMEKNGDTWKYEYNGNGLMSKVVRPDKTEVLSSMTR
ncbi:hypothetical protein [Lysinibacillus sp. NPDC056185]|uniref:hypothetical protein n=1 Tax=Lysinibacillus sp. NPDC056185 TaxID=3345739 RepID=UPI0039EDF49F